MFRTVVWYMLFFGATVVQAIAHVVLYLLQVGNRKSVPPPKNPVLRMSASQIAKQIREGQLRSEDVVQTFIERIREVNTYINAVAEERFEEALVEARSADLFIQSKVKTQEEIAAEKPLLGVPVSIKMLFSVKGLRCNAGSIIYKDVKAHEDAQTVVQMKNAGAICLVTTNSPEFGVNIETYNYIYGLTRNPHDTRRTPGGSSGGESALISAAGSVLGVGNDLLGSLRFPAFCTGIFSHKPTNGIVSNEGIFPKINGEFLRHLCSGPMCRYAEDLPLSMKILLDPRYSHMKFDVPVNFSSITLYYIENEGRNPTVPLPQKDILQAQLKVVNHFRAVYGCKVEKVEMKSMKHCFVTSYSASIENLDKPLEEYFYPNKSKISPIAELFKSVFRLSNRSFSTVATINMRNFSLTKEEGERQIQKMRSEIESVLGPNSVLIAPTFPKKAVYHYETLLLFIGSGYTSVCNLLGLPSTQCPVGRAADGLPLGVQVIGAKNYDYLTIAFAKEIEKAFGGWVVPNDDDVNESN